MRCWLWRNEASYLHATKQELLSVVLKCCARIWRVNSVCIVLCLKVAMVKWLRIWTGGTNVSRQFDLSAVSTDASYELNKSLLWFSLGLFALKQHHPVFPSSWHWEFISFEMLGKNRVFPSSNVFLPFIPSVTFSFTCLNSSFCSSWSFFLFCFSQCPLLFPHFFSCLCVCFRRPLPPVLWSCLVCRCCAVPLQLIVWCLWW